MTTTSQKTPTFVARQSNNTEDIKDIDLEFTNENILADIEQMLSPEEDEAARND